MKPVSFSKQAYHKPLHQNAGKALSRVIGKIITPLCRKYGLMTADLVLEWPQIVGEELAQVCQVMKIRFPGLNRQQGCLHLQTNSAMAMALTYSQPIILERVNQYYGYQAVSQIRVFHKSVPSSPLQKVAIPNPIPELPPEWQSLMQDIDDQNLHQALENLGRGLQVSERG